jgi:hypothetical protein
MAEHSIYKKCINACKLLRIRKEDSRFLSINWHIVVADVAKEFPAFNPCSECYYSSPLILLSLQYFHYIYAQIFYVVSSSHVS